MPENFLPHLRELIACSIAVEDDHAKGSSLKKVELIERDNVSGEKIYSIEITGLPMDSFVFKADAFPQPQALFNDVQEVRKRADYILLAKDSDKKRIVFIEMKSSKDSEHGIIAQLRGAACIMDYCNAVLKRVWGDSACVKGFEERFVSCSHASGKKGTRPKRNDPIHNVPANLLKLKGHSITYQQLIRS